MEPVTGGKNTALRRGWGFLPAALVLVACGGESPVEAGPDPRPDPDPEPEASAVWVEPARATVEAGQTMRLVAFVQEPGSETEPLPDDVAWSSSSNAIATVSGSGLVSAVADGVVTITGTTADGGTASARITVGDDRLVWAQLEGEGAHRCGVTVDGVAHCWGDGAVGKLGNGSTSRQPTPTPVAGGHTFASISLATTHSCGVTTGGDAYCWGEGGQGQLGDGAGLPSTTPVLVAGGHEFSSISAGDEYTCALTVDGAAYCWGRGTDGRLGTGSAEDTTTPSEVLGGHVFTQIVAGAVVTCAVTTAAEAYCWGNGAFAQMGDGRRGFLAGDECPVRNCRDEPYRVRNAPTLVRIAVSETSVCGVATDGVQHCWGGSSADLAPVYTSWDEVLAAGFSSYTIFYPIPVSDQPRFTTLSGAGGVMCGLDGAGAPFCWGGIAMLDGSEPGSLGDGTKVSSLVPVEVDGDLTASHISVGRLPGELGGYGCVVTTDGRGFCWGGTWLSDGTIATFLSPVQVADP